MGDLTLNSVFEADSISILLNWGLAFICNGLT
jgi:hypothetical protein